jgi:hypothetical protein
MAILFNLGAFFSPIYERAMEDPQLWIGIGLASSLLIAMILNGFTISLYKNRKKQMSWLKRASLMQIIAFGFSIGVIFSLGGIGTYLWDEALGTGLVFLGFVSQFLALLRIRKDEELVKSMDRIR